MDQVLRQTKLGSVSARLRKFRERELAAKENEERNFKMLIYGYSSEEEEISDDDGSHNTYSPLLDPDTDLAHFGEFPSVIPLSHQHTTASQQSKPRWTSTPSSPLRAHRAASSLPPCFQEDLVDNYAKDDISPAPASFRSLVHPTFQPQLDFTSTSYLNLDSPDFDDSPPPSPTFELESPIEIATPVAYSQPRHRPSMISIRRTLPATTPPPSIPPPPIPRQRFLSTPSKPEDRLSSSTTYSGFLACEATPFQLPVHDIPYGKQMNSSNASQAGAYDSPDTLTFYADAKKPDLPLRRRPSMGGPRLSSLKKFILGPQATENPDSKSIKSPTTSYRSSKEDRTSTGSMSVMSSPRDIHTPGFRPRTATTSSGSPSSTSSFQDGQSLNFRPRTATSSSATSWGTQGVTALPKPEDFSHGEFGSDTTDSMPETKTVSSLRKRGTSMGKALKSASSSMNLKGRLSLKPSFSMYFDDVSSSKKRMPEKDLNLFDFDIPTSPAESNNSSMLAMENPAISFWKRPGMKARVTS